LFHGLLQGSDPAFDLLQFEACLAWLKMQSAALKRVDAGAPLSTIIFSIVVAAAEGSHFCGGRLRV
jgi:hypothetical protein